MHQRSLRTVLLIQAIEETDRLGEVIPLADRADASRAVVRESSKLSEAKLRAEAPPPAQTPPLGQTPPSGQTQPPDQAPQPRQAQPSALLSPQVEAFLVRRTEAFSGPCSARRS